MPSPAAHRGLADPGFRTAKTLNILPFLLRHETRCAAVGNRIDAARTLNVRTPTTSCRPPNPAILRWDPLNAGYTHRALEARALGILSPPLKSVPIAFQQKRRFDQEEQLY